MKKFISFIREWKLPVAMLLGVVAYFVFVALPLSSRVHRLAYEAVSDIIQPTLIFCMLFLSFCKVRPQEMRPHRWQALVLLVQGLLFLLCSVGALMVESDGEKLLFEGAMLCFICPTATASAVIVGKLGGNVAGDVTYIMLCNLMVSVLCPLMVPLVEPHAGMDFFTSFYMILGKVFPLLIMPLVAAWFVRYLLPDLHRWFLRFPDLAFYMWLVALALAIAVTVRSVIHTTIGMGYLAGLAVVSLVCCIIQFAVGKAIGSRYDRRGSTVNRITAGQAFGQKNTVFAIWAGLVFLNPVTSIVGGFYSVWHNVINSFQLHNSRRA